MADSYSKDRRRRRVGIIFSYMIRGTGPNPTADARPETFRRARSGGARSRRRRRRRRSPSTFFFLTSARNTPPGPDRSRMQLHRRLAWPPARSYVTALTARKKKINKKNHELHREPDRMAGLPEGQRTGRRVQPVRTRCDRLFDMLAVPDQADGRPEGGERLPVADLRTARDQHPGPGAEQPEARAGERQRQETNQKVNTRNTLQYPHNVLRVWLDFPCTVIVRTVCNN